MKPLGIGVIGLGRMGHPIAANVLKAGLALKVFNRTRQKEEDLLGEGASLGNTGEPWHAADGTEPPADLNATAQYKQHLARVMTRRAVSEAAGL